MDNCPPIDGVVVSWTIVHEIKYFSLFMDNLKIWWTILKFGGQLGNFKKNFTMSNLNCISKFHGQLRNLMDNHDLVDNFKISWTINNKLIYLEIKIIKKKKF